MLIDLHAHAPHPDYYNQHPHWGPFFEQRPDGDIKLRVGHWILSLGSPERRAALEKARAHIRDRLTQLAPVFLKNKYMLGENFSMLDVAIAPLLWRLDYYGIEVSKNAAPLLKYAERIFSRPAYIEALTPSEKVMRK